MKNSSSKQRKEEFRFPTSWQKSSKNSSRFACKSLKLTKTCWLLDGDWFMIAKRCLFLKCLFELQCLPTSCDSLRLINEQQSSENSVGMWVDPEKLIRKLVEQLLWRIIYTSHFKSDSNHTAITPTDESWKLQTVNKRVSGILAMLSIGTKRCFA